MELFTRHTYGDTTTYVPYKPEIADRELTEESVLTLCSSLCMTVIMQYRQLVPEHKRNARKVKAVENALFDMLRGSGHSIDEDMANYAIECWNLAVMTMTEGGKS